jgi:hypothetical protein
VRSGFWCHLSKEEAENVVYVFLERLTVLHCPLVLFMLLEKIIKTQKMKGSNQRYRQIICGSMLADEPCSESSSSGSAPARFGSIHEKRSFISSHRTHDMVRSGTAADNLTLRKMAGTRGVGTRTRGEKMDFCQQVRLVSVSERVINYHANRGFFFVLNCAVSSVFCFRNFPKS